MIVEVSVESGPTVLNRAPDAHVTWGLAIAAQPPYFGEGHADVMGGLGFGEYNLGLGEETEGGISKAVGLHDFLLVLFAGRGQAAAATARAAAELA